MHTPSRGSDRPQARAHRVTGHRNGSHPDRMDIESTIARVEHLAAGGPFSAERAGRFGVSADALAACLRRGRLERVTRGWYDVPRPGLSAVQRHARLVSCLVARCGGRAVASHQSGLVLHGLPLAAVSLRVAHLTHVGSGPPRRAQDHVLHRRPRGLAEAPSGDRLAVEWCLLQVGATYGARAAIVPGDAALRLGVATRESLDGALKLHRGAPGSLPAAAAMALLDGRSESPGESLLRYDLTVLGYDVVPQQPVVVAGQRFRPDLVVRGTKVAAEFDGKTKYSDPSAFTHEKLREEAMRDDGWLFVRFMWPDLGRLSDIDRRMQTALRTWRAQAA